MKDDQENKGERGYTIKDKRRFETNGTAREDAPESSYEKKESAEPKASLPEIDFSTFILSLVTSAMVHLGEAPHPDGKPRKDLTLAKQTIDILGMLQDKTKGNLTDEESKLIEELLYDLRMRYVNATR